MMSGVFGKVFTGVGEAVTFFREQKRRNFSPAQILSAHLFSLKSQVQCFVFAKSMFFFLLAPNQMLFQFLLGIDDS